MTPVQLAENMAKSDDFDAQVLAVGMIARGLSDNDPKTLRQGWPLEVSVERAAVFLGLEPTSELLTAAFELAPTIPDAVLNYR